MERVYIDKLESLVIQLGDVYDEVVPFKVFEFDKQFEEDIKDVYDAALCVFQNACDDKYYSTLDAKVDLQTLVLSIDVCLADYDPKSAWFKVISSLQIKIKSVIEFLKTNDGAFN